MRRAFLAAWLGILVSPAPAAGEGPEARAPVLPAGAAADPAAVREAAARAREWLCGLQKASGAIALGDRSLFEVWETVCSLRALTAWADPGKPVPVLERGLSYLKDSENADGLLLHRKGVAGACCLETSSEYVRLLSRLERKGLLPSGPARARAGKIRARQLPSGGWRIESPAIPERLQEFPSVSGFALQALWEAGLAPRDQAAAIAFLARSQTKRGDWGEDWRYYGTPFYALAAVLEGIEGLPGGERSRALVFIESARTGKGSYRAAAAGPSEELETVLAVSSLLSCGIEASDPRVAGTLSWLLSRQREDGSWDGGRFPLADPRKEKNEDVFCTARALLLLRRCLPEPFLPPVTPAGPSAAGGGS